MRYPIYKSPYLKEELYQQWVNTKWDDVHLELIASQAILVSDYRNSDINAVRQRQIEILNNPLIHLAAVRRVTAASRGKSPGIDGESYRTPSEKIEQVHKLAFYIKNIKNYEAAPLKRVWIPKTGSSELRPLSLPTVFDKIAQCMYYFAINPIIEEQGCPHSFGFRPIRDVGCVVQRLITILRQVDSSAWIVNADISKCFDRISHDFLLDNCIIPDKRALKAWLEAPIYDHKDKNHIKKRKMGLPNLWDLERTLQGTPQGGVISPILANLALNGLEMYLIERLTNYRDARDPNHKCHVVRYADDFVIAAPTRRKAKELMYKATKFLTKRGLELNTAKTSIVPITTGFNIVGFTFKKYPRDWVKNSPRKVRKNQKYEGRDLILLVYPSDDNVNKLKDKVRLIFKDKDITPLRLLRKLNPILTGWRTAFAKSYRSIRTFQSLDKWLLVDILLPWLKSHHSTGRYRCPIKRIIKLYRRPLDSQSYGEWTKVRRLDRRKPPTWKWRIGIEDPKTGRLIVMPRLYEPKTHTNNSVDKLLPIPYDSKITPIRKERGEHLLIQDVNPYTIAGLEWWSKRKLNKRWGKETTKTIRELAITRCKNKCAFCGLPLGWNAEGTEIHRIIPATEGGRYTSKNVTMVHRTCHQNYHSRQAQQKKLGFTTDSLRFLACL